MANRKISELNELTGTPAGTTLFQWWTAQEVHR